MPSITSTGIGSGLDIGGLVQNLVQAEGQARSARLDQREAAFLAKLSAYGSFRGAVDKLRSALSSLKTIDGFAGRAATSSNPEVVTATASATAPPGRYAVEVLQLASAHKLRSAPRADAASLVGTGTLAIAVGGRTLSLTIDSGNGSLAGIRDAINGAAGNPGVAAAVVTGIAGAQLVLTSRDTGAANTISVTQSGGDGGLAALVYDPSTSTFALSEVDSAADARILVDGVEAASAKNSFSSVLSGLTIEAVAVSTPGEATRLQVDYDVAGARERIAAFVSAYNSLVENLRGLSSYDAASKAAGPLFGDATFRDFSESVRRFFSTGAPGGGLSFGTLADLGISRQLDGTLEISDTKLAAALAGSFDEAGRFLADARHGLGARLDALLERYVSAGGAIDVRVRGLKESIDSIGEDRAALEARLTAYEARLRAQFNALDGLVARLRSTGDFLTQQLARLPATTIRKE